MLHIKGSEIQLTRGDTAYLNVIVTKSSDSQTYTMKPEDTLTLTVKKTVNDSDFLLQKVVEGTNTIHILPEDTSELEYGSYKYDVQLNTEEGDVFTIIEPATFKILPEVTF